MFSFVAVESALLGASASWSTGRPLICPSTSSIRHAKGSTQHRVVVHCGRRGSSGRDNKRRGDGRRPNRVGELIRREVSPIITDAYARAFRGAESSSAVMVSVVDVRCSDDLRNANVSVSVLGSNDQKTEALKWLRAAKKEIRFELAKSVHLKYIPELSFTESEMAQAVQTVNILNKLAKEREEKVLRQQQEPGSVGPESGMSFTSQQGLDLDASAEDAIILDEFFDEDADAEDALIINVTEEDEDLEEMDDEKLRDVLFKTLGNEDFGR